MFMTCQTRASYERKIEKLEGDYQSLIKLNNQIYNEQERLRRVASQCKDNATHLERKVKSLEGELEKQGEHNAEETRKNEINLAIQKLEEVRDSGGSIDVLVEMDEYHKDYTLSFSSLNAPEGVREGAINLDKLREIYKETVEMDVAHNRRFSHRGYRKIAALRTFEETLKALGVFENITGKRGNE